MAVTVGEPVPVGRAPRAFDFVRLKLRLLRNGFRGQTWRIIAFVLGLTWGLIIAGLAFIVLSATGTASRDAGFTWAVLVGGVTVLGWTLFPLLFFGVDETLDPARFALLPLRRPVLARGMLAAALVGVPSTATLLATSGLVVAGAIRFGGPGAVTALVGVALGLCLGVVASRAVTSAFAAMLRSRRVRDLAVVIIAVLASSIGPLQWAATSAAQHGSLNQALRVATIVSWTPFGAPYALPFDVGEHNWAAAGARLAITVATFSLLLWWWSRTLESAMLGVTGSSGPAKVVKGGDGGAVAALVPRALRRFVQPNPFGAVVAGEWRFWWRDARRRAGLISILMASTILPIVMLFASRAASDGAARASLPFGFAVTMSGTLAGMLLANQFAYDGSAFAAHLLTRVPGRVELRARAVALALVTLPIQIAVTVVVCVLDGSVQLVPAGLGMLATGFGGAVAAASLLSVLAAYPLPETQNPFALNSGGGSAKGLLALLAMMGTLVISSPVTLAAYYLNSAATAWLVLAVGLGYGTAAALIGTLIAGDRIDRRGPELLIAVTPRR